MFIINVYLKGGVIQNVFIPQGCDAIVRIVDYDCEDGDCSDTDDEGSPCTVAIYEASETPLEAT